MKYLMLVCIDRPTDAGPRDLGRAVGTAPDEIDVDAWVDEMDGRGARLIGDRIRPNRDSTTVRVRDNKVLLTDGPYARQGPRGWLRRDRVCRPRRGGRDRIEASDGAGRCPGVAAVLDRLSPDVGPDHRHVIRPAGG